MHLKLRLRLRSLAGLTSLFFALLAIGSIAVSFGAAAPAYAVVGDCTPGSNWGTINSSFEAQVLTLVNQHRSAMGLATLSTSPILTNAAHWKSLHMAFYRYMQHDDPAPPVARTVSDRLAACGYPIGSVSWGENIAYGYATPQDVMNAWLNSPGHKANIENPSYRAIGIGAARNTSGVYYWTQDFGSLVDSGTPPPPPPPPPPAPAPANTALPVITGTAQQGQNVYTSNGAWSGSPTSYKYQWLRCDSGGANCVAIGGEIFSGITVSAADVNHTLRVTVTAANANGSASATAGPTAVVPSSGGGSPPAPPAVPANTGLPLISGTALQGQNLYTTNGSWSGSPTSFTYQWLRCDGAGANCVPNWGEIFYGVTLSAADVNHTIRVTVTAANANGSTSATSAATAVVR